jgi:hypothetical protein
MDKKTYIWDNESQKIVLKSEYIAKKSTGPVIIGDIKPYKNVINGEEVAGRTAHRNFLKKYDLVEVGNEKPRAKVPEPLPPIRDDIMRALAQHKNR